MPAFDLSDMPPDFFDPEKCRMRNAMVIKYIGALTPKGHHDLRATPEQLARCFWIDARVRDMAIENPNQFNDVDSVYRALKNRRGPA